MNAPTSDPGLRAQRAYNQPRALPFAGPTNYRDIKGRALSRQESVGEEERSEHVKPLNGIQLVQIQPGQRRSWQAGSESCTCVGRPAR